MKKMPINTAHTHAAAFFQTGSSTDKGAGEACAILSSMFPILAVLAALVAAAQPADLAIVNATIYTGKGKARAMAIRNGRIIAIGDSAIGDSVGPAARTIDMKGAPIITGLIDSHVHMEGLGLQIETFDLRNVKTVADVAAIVRKRAASLPAGAWIRGRSWDQTNWGGEFPTHDALTAAAPAHPVYLTRVDGHAGWVNQKALELAGIDDKTPDPMGGKIVRDKAGHATGVLIDRAQGLVGSKIPNATDDEVISRIRAAAIECARLGITSVHDAGIDEQDLRAYRKLLAAGQLPVRVYAMIGGEGRMWSSFLAKGPEVHEMLTVRSIKLMADGAMGSRGAAFWQPYSDDPGNTGLMILKSETVERVARQALDKGFQVNTHAIGDRANKMVLEAYVKVLGEDSKKRFRVEHAQAVALPDFALFKKAGVIASMQSTHATSDMRWALARLGPDRISGAYAQKRMLNAGVVVANGSDFPVEEPNPLHGFYAAVARQDLQGNPKGGWRPEERFTREEALRSWTWAGAYAAFEEDWKGTLEVGKVADFLVLSGDIMTLPVDELPRVKVRATYVAGKPVYSDQ
ncbi:MAG: amidohydrolase [Acidobacteria bacterium]|nr:amidohydrolase [Acidobacteriota bacterium]